MKTFCDVLESAQALSYDEQKELVDVLGRQMAEERREELAKAIQQARAEFASGRARPASPTTILKRIMK